MRVALEFTFHTDIISVPDELGKNINKYQQKFDKWLYDKTNDHGYWVYINGRNMAVSFDTTTFVDYLNDLHLCNSLEKAFIVEENVEKFSSDIPKLFF